MKRNSRFAAWAALAVGAVALPGCGPRFASIIPAMHPGIPVEPKFVLTKGPLLVMVEDRENWLTSPQPKDELIAEIARKFREHDVNDRLIDQAKLRQLQQDQPNFDKMLVGEVGRHLGADQVLYIYVEKFNLRTPVGPDSDPEGQEPIFKGVFQVNVRVVNAKAKDFDDPEQVCLWPGTPGQGESFEVEEPLSVSDEAGYADELSKKLATRLAQKVALSFYKHRVTIESQMEDQ